MSIQTLGQLKQFYEDQIHNDIMPFWTDNAIDWERGGIFTGIKDDGTVLTTNKYIWSNARAIYTFSALCNRIEDKKIWRQAADNIFEFCLKNGRDSEGRWIYLTDRDGKQLEGEKAIQVDAFAIMGLVEYAKLTGDKRAIDAAVETYHSARNRLAKPGTYGTFPYPTPEGYIAHRDYFQFAFAFFELGWYLNDETIIEHSLEKAGMVMDCFRQPERNGLVEYVSESTHEFVDTPVGRTMVPGHAIEAMWFLIHVYRETGDTERIRQAIETIHGSIEKGWDPEYGGILLGIDIDNKEEPYWKNWEKKIWWVFVEALYGLLLAYEHAPEQWCLDWYARVHEWAFRHFPVPEHGEWTQRLDREGKVTDTVVALPVKDPFHLPRAFILSAEVLGRLTAAGKDTTEIQIES
ncbi:MAG: AGE family epimerase/isomerase [Spirochaetota bacterium]